MSAADPRPSVRLPGSAFAILSHRCAGLGDAGVRTLREAGYRAGVDLLPRVAPNAEAMDRDAFFAALDERLRESGLGSVARRAVSPALDAVAWRESPEAGGPRSADARPRCHFAAGLLGGILSRAAGGTVDVLEVRCGHGGSEPCWFLVGSVRTIRAVQDARRDRSGGTAVPDDGERVAGASGPAAVPVRDPAPASGP